MTTEMGPLVLALSAGVLLGALFFGGLWWTLRKGLPSNRPALWFSGSLMLRYGIVLAGFHFVGGGQWQRLLACLAGFFMARLITTRLVKALGKAATLDQEVNHATKS